MKAIAILGILLAFPIIALGIVLRCFGNRRGLIYAALGISFLIYWSVR